MASIKLHPEHGVNPMIPTCFWCGEHKNEILLLGYNRGKKAPMSAVVDLEPCDACKEKMALGITFMEAVDGPDGGSKLTGKWVVVKESSHIIDALQPEAMRDAVRKHRKAFLALDAWDKLGLPREGKKGGE